MGYGVNKIALHCGQGECRSGGKDSGAANVACTLELRHMAFWRIPMTIAKQIFQYLAVLPEKEQREVLDFVEFLENRCRQQSQRLEDENWSTLSLASAMQGLENDPVEYTSADLKEMF